MTPAVDNTLWVGALLVLVLTAVFALALRPLALEVGLADDPGGRKKHSGRVPLIGGISMLLAVGFGSSLVAMPPFWSALSTAVILLVVVGTIDDRFDLSPAIRLVAQAVAASLAAFAAGILITDLGAPLSFQLSLGPVAGLFTVLFVMTIVNGFNLIDGIDGLAGGVAFVSITALAILGAGTQSFPALMLIGAAVAGFLMFNLPVEANRRVKIFMGDAGSTALGFAIATIGIVMSQGGDPTLVPVIGLWLVAVPLYEVIAAVWRRMRDGRSPWVPDDKHLHHGLLARGISPRRTLAFMMLLAAGFALVGVIGHRADASDALMFGGWLAGGVFYYRITRRPRPIAAWVQSWKASEDTVDTFDATVVESGGAMRQGDSSD